MQLDTIDEAIRAFANGEMVIVVDDDDRENEGDLIMAACKASPAQVAFMIRHTSGILCAPLTGERARALNLEPMVRDNDAPLRTAFTVSVDYREGMTTGIAAEERANTVRALANGNVIAGDFVRPGHVFPLIARDGGVLVRTGHTEAATDLAKLAELPEVGLLGELAGAPATARPGLTALNPFTGKIVWSDPAPKAPCHYAGDRSSDYSQGACIRAQSAAPAAMPGVVFSGTMDGWFRAYDARTGKVIWAFSTTAQTYDTVNGVKDQPGGGIDGLGPAIADGMVYTMSGFNGASNTGGNGNNVLLAFSVDGK